MFKNKNNVETVLRLREMLVRAMMADNDVMQQLVLNKLEELGLKRKDELKYAEKIIKSDKADNTFKKVAQTAENGVKKAVGLASAGINHQYGTNRRQIVGSYALVYRKDRSYPVYVFAPFDEYQTDSKIWKQYPSAMILKVAESMALKRAFSVSGLVSREEMAVQQQKKDINQQLKQRSV